MVHESGSSPEESKGDPNSIRHPQEAFQERTILGTDLTLLHSAKAKLAIIGRDKTLGE